MVLLLFLNSGKKREEKRDLEKIQGACAQQGKENKVLQSCQSLSTCDLRKHLTPITGPLTSNSASTEPAVTRGDSLIRYTSSSDNADTRNNMY